jgi:hypothetical protein
VRARPPPGAPFLRCLSERGSSAPQVDQAIAAAVATFGIRGCAARVAQAYGEHPETAALRMRWARATAIGAFGGARPELARVSGTRPLHRSDTCCAA